jgi:hypothetical protein
VRLDIHTYRKKAKAYPGVGRRAERADLTLPEPRSVPAQRPTAVGSVKNRTRCSSEIFLVDLEPPKRRGAPIRWQHLGRRESAEKKLAARANEGVLSRKCRRGGREPPGC